MIVTFYHYNGDPKIVNKTLANGYEINCDFKIEPQSILNPVLEVDVKCSGYNYAVIDKRKYFIVKEELLFNKRVRLILEEDVLSTWHDIVKVDGVLDRSSINFNSDLKQELPMQVNKQVRRISYNDMQVHLGQTIIAQSSYPYNVPNT